LAHAVTMRAGVYTRVSKEEPDSRSCADQERELRGLAAQLGAHAVRVFEDKVSGRTIAERPGMQALLAACAAGEIDVVLAEHSDRLSRGFETGTIFEDLRGWGVGIITLNQGPVSALHVGVGALVSVLQLEEGARKTRRGLKGVVLAGRSAGGCPYGYRVRTDVRDGRGDRVAGLREIDPDQAAVVVRIFEGFAAGKSAYGLACELNAEGVASPRGGVWRGAAIYGSPDKGRGILWNDLYRGLRVWGRTARLKVRSTGKRRETAGGELVSVPAPELRIVGDDLWAQAHAAVRANMIGDDGSGRGKRRPRRLLQGLIRCGLCGHVMCLQGSRDYLRCQGRSQGGPAVCEAPRRPRYAHVEARVLESVRANLMHPDVVAEAVAEFQRTAAAGRRDAAQARGGLERQLREAEGRAARLIDQVEQGMPWAAVAERHAAHQATADALRARLAQMAEPEKVVELHANAAALYAREIAEVTAGLTAADPAFRKAAEAVRALVSRVEVLPLPERGRYELAIDADLEPLLAPAAPMVRVTNSRSRFGRSHDAPLTVRLRA
jgi:site-specific DNA recombinase